MQAVHSYVPIKSYHVLFFVNAFFKILPLWDFPLRLHFSKTDVPFVSHGVLENEFAKYLLAALELVF